MLSKFEWHWRSFIWNLGAAMPTWTWPSMPFVSMSLPCIPHGSITSLDLDYLDYLDSLIESFRLVPWMSVSCWNKGADANTLVQATQIPKLQKLFKTGRTGLVKGLGWQSMTMLSQRVKIIPVIWEMEGKSSDILRYSKVCACLCVCTWYRSVFRSPVGWNWQSIQEISQNPANASGRHETETGIWKLCLSEIGSNSKGCHHSSQLNRPKERWQSQMTTLPSPGIHECCEHFKWCHLAISTSRTRCHHFVGSLADLCHLEKVEDFSVL